MYLLFMPETKREILNLFETLIGAVLSLQQESQELKDEINRLKDDKASRSSRKAKVRHPTTP